MSVAQKEAELSRNKERITEMRARDGSMMRQNDQQSKQRQRANMSEVEKAQRRLTDKEAKRNSITKKAQESRDVARALAYGDARGVKEYRLGSLDQRCSNCNALHWREERVQGKQTFNDCCRHGKIDREFCSWPKYPAVLEFYFTGTYNQRDKRVFLENIRRVNNSFAVGSFCSSQYAYKTNGPPCLRIYGQTFRRINEKLLPDEDGSGNKLSLNT